MDANTLTLRQQVILWASANGVPADDMLRAMNHIITAPPGVCETVKRLSSDQWLDFLRIVSSARMTREFSFIIPIDPSLEIRIDIDAGTLRTRHIYN